MTSQAKWTIMVYLAGDNNLSTAGEKDLSEMRAIGSTRNINIVAEFDNIGALGSYRYHIHRDGANETAISLGETDSGDPGTLLDFISWAHENYAAERYALILWNHGGGWAPAEMDLVARSVGAQNYNVREASERSSSPLGKIFFRTSLEKIFSLSSPSERAICSDDGSGHSLDTVELGRVLGEAVAILGQPLDILGMDACLMSNLEVAYQVRSFARYLIASEETEPNDGWPYDAVLGRLARNPDLETHELAAHIVQAYVQSYLDRDYTGAVTQSALDLSRVDRLTPPLDRLAGVLSDHMPNAAVEVWKAQRGSARFFHKTLWDIAHFCEEIEKGTSSHGVRTAALEVRRALKASPDNFVIAESHSGKALERCRGVSVYLPSPLTEISRFYDDLDFAQAFRWHEMLHAYHTS